MEKRYSSQKVEDKIYSFWQKSGFFNPDKLPKRHKKPYSQVLLPPNITGELHIGHALNAICQDILIRQKRMQGYKTLWVPGIDHAGIITQYVKEKQQTIKILFYVLLNSLKLLHPFMPFITEEIYQRFPKKGKKALIIENWPKDY